MSRFACFGQLVWGTPLEVSVQCVVTSLYTRVCTYRSEHDPVHASLYMQICTYEPIPTSAYIQTCTYEPVHTSLYIQIHTFKPVHGVCVQIYMSVLGCPPLCIHTRT